MLGFSGSSQGVVLVLSQCCCDDFVGCGACLEKVFPFPCTRSVPACAVGAVFVVFIRTGLQFSCSSPDLPSVSWGFRKSPPGQEPGVPLPLSVSGCRSPCGVSPCLSWGCSPSAELLLPFHWCQTSSLGCGPTDEM